MEDKKIGSKAEYEESSDQQTKTAERRKKYALILANRDKLKQVFKMYGSIENGEETMSIVEYINMASSFNLTPKIISFSNLRKLLTERTDVWELPAKKQLFSEEKRQNLSEPQKKEKMSFRQFERSLIVLSVIGFKKGTTQERLSLLFDYLRQKTKMDFVSEIQTPQTQLAQLIGREGVQTLKAKLNNAVLSQCKQFAKNSEKSPLNSGRKPAQGERPSRKHKSHMNEQGITLDSTKGQNATPRMNYSFQIAPGEYKRDESPDTSYLSVKDASRGFQISHRQPVNMSTSPQTRVDQINMMLIQNLKKKSKHHIQQNNSLDLVSLDPERVNRSYRVESVAGKHSGLTSPSQRAKLSKKLRSLGGGSQSVTGRADSTLTKSGKKKHSSTKGRHNPRLAQMAGQIGLAPNSERTTGKFRLNAESLPPIMNPNEGHQSSTPLQDRNNSIIASTYENLANREKGRDTPDSSSLRKTGLKAAHLEQYINESKHRSMKTYSNPYDTSQRAARSISNSQRSNTLTLGYQFQKRIENKLSKSKTFKRKAVSGSHSQFMTDTNTDRSSVPKARDQTSSDAFTTKKPFGRVILSTGQTPQPLGHLSLESTRSWRSQRLNKLSPRDSSVESSRLSVHSINLAPFNLRTVNPHPPSLPQPQLDAKGLKKGGDNLDMSARSSLRKQRDILRLSESIELQESSVGTPQQQSLIAKYQKRVKAAEMRANEYKKKLERAREILKAFQKKMKEVEEKHKQRVQKKNQDENARPYSASNIYHNITIYANNSVNNNNISINSGSQSDLEDKKGAQDGKETQDLKQLLATREAKLKEMAKKLEISKRNEEKLMKQILVLNKRKHENDESIQ